MFSVGASPYNSRARQLYGGLAGGDAIDDVYGGDAIGDVYGGFAATIPHSAETGLPEGDVVAYYRDNPANYAQDAKWANLALRFSPNRLERILAKAIKEKMKRDQIKTLKQNADWKKKFLAARALMRPTYFRKHLDGDQKGDIWAAIDAMKWGKRASDRDKLYLSMLSRAPYTSPPGVPAALNMPQAVLNDITTKYTNELPALMYTGTRAAQNFLV